ncbi:Uncharacterized protein, contains a NRPS condensation (elongation) domain [Ruaniaceae bacterium KH17]|nr:Uncharacterized protein, contains a NRPS condensation (elongation) domain [Ruaniaceae bacterium KH17]
MARTEVTTHGRNWVRLDNASNIFLAARSEIDPKVFRLSAEMSDDVDPALLQRALDHTYDRYPLYHAVLRRGIFWYYLQDSDLRPEVALDDQYTCAPLYQVDRKNLLFRVVYFQRRIVLEVFHALSDGTGALWFLTDLLVAYAQLRMSGELPATDDTLPPHELSTDSFAEYFFTPAAPLAREVVEEPSPRTPWTQIHHPRGTRSADGRTRAVELTMPASEVLALAKAEGVSLTSYLIALFFESIRAGGLGRARTLTASVPVNLRQFFPSTSARNFFATVRVQHAYTDGETELGEVCRDIETQLRAKATQAAMERKVRRLIRFERNPALRIFPRPLKDVILSLINWGNSRGLTVAISNMGRVVFPEQAEAQVKRLLLHIAPARPQFCAVSQNGMLTVCFTSPFVETDHVREYARLLTGRGVDLMVAATRVTESEIAEVTNAAM